VKDLFGDLRLYVLIEVKYREMDAADILVREPLDSFGPVSHVRMEPYSPKENVVQSSTVRAFTPNCISVCLVRRSSLASARD